MAIFGVALGLWPRLAAATDACAENRVEAAGVLDPEWEEELRRVCQTIGELPDLDTTTRVRVVAGTPVVVIATLPDGRTAHRDVRSVAALRHTIEALVTLPPSFVEPAPAEKKGERGTASPEAPTRPAESSKPPPAPEPLPFSVEIGGVAVARLQGTPLYASIGPVAWAAFNFSDWLFGISARWDGYQTLPGLYLENFEMMTFGASLEFTRRTSLHPIVGLDLGASLSVVHELQSFEAGSGEEEEGEATDVRLGLLTRLQIGGRGPRFTVQGDFEISPARLGHESIVDEGLPTLPSFGGGIGLGASWQSP